MLWTFIGELIAAMVGDVIMGTLFPTWSKREPPPEEGAWNASIGTVAAFLAALAAMFGGLSSFILVTGRYESAIGWLLLVSMIAALAAGVLAHRTFQVTKRRHGLARVGLWLSRATVTVIVVAVLFSVFRGHP